jgi:hypothetical protein
MTNPQEPILDAATEQRVDATCLVVELSGQTWHVPFDTLPVIPRVGETIRLTGGSAGQVAEVEYECTPEMAPVRVAREMPAGVSYARPVRRVIRLS